MKDTIVKDTIGMYWLGGRAVTIGNMFCDFYDWDKINIHKCLSYVLRIIIS